ISDQKDNTLNTSENTKFAKQPIVETLSKVGETNALSKPVTSNSVSTIKESKGVNNDKVIAPGMFRINPSKTSREEKHVPNTVIQICLWCVNSGCFKHMTGNLKLLINFVWKFMGTVRFEIDHVAAILGFGNLQWGNILITRVYFVEGLGHNLFSVGQFCDSDLEVAFRRNACFVRNLEGVDLLKGDRSTNLYTINLHETASASPICLMARASSTKSWLWHLRLSHLNFDTINDLAINDLVAGLPKFKYHKEHLCPSCEQGKSKRASHPPKPAPNSRQRLHLLHMDLCGPMRIDSINGKRQLLRELFRLLKNLKFNIHTFYQPYPHEFQWTKDHPLDQVIEEPLRPVLTRNQLRSDGDICMYALSVSTMEPKNVKEAMTNPAWIDSMQEELLQFKRLDDSGFELIRFSNVDYAGCKDTFKSTFGGAQFLGSVDGVTTSFQLSQNSRHHMLDHQDKYMMKAQVHVSKSSAIFDVQPPPRRKHYCQIYQVVKHMLRGRLLASFQDCEHEGGDTRSQGGIKDNDIKIKIQDHSMQMISQMNSQEQGSKSQKSFSVE
nr:retrovirus-related Pol polyprotein from transposon TNT 1-94 [Tanacetum cinerariifolium]